MNKFGNIVGQEVKEHPTYEDVISKTIDTTLNQFGGGNNKEAIKQLKSLKNINHMNLPLVAVAYKYYIENNEEEGLNYSLFSDINNKEMKEYINVIYKSNGGIITKLNHDISVKIVASLYRYVSYIDRSFS